MEQASNSFLGKAVRSRRAMQNIGHSLLEAPVKPAHADAIDLRQPTPDFGRGAPQPQQASAQQNPQLRLGDRNPYFEPRSSEEWVPLIDPRNLFKAVTNAKKLIGLLSIIGLGLGILVAMSTPKYYYSTAEILIDPRDLQISDRELLPTGLPYDASLALVENQTRILTSRRVILGTVEKLNLDQDAEYNGKGLAAPGPLGVLKAIVFGRESDDPAKAKELAVENLLEVTGVSRTPKTFVISLTVRSENPEKAALIANTMAEVYMDVQDEIQSDTVGRANGELGGRLEELRNDVEKAERLVEAYRSENDLFDANGKLISDDEIVLSSTQLTRAREKVAELRARADSARELKLDAVLSDALPEGAASNLIAELRRGYASKVQQRDALAEKLGAQHPQLRTAEAEVTSAKRGIETELRRLSQTAQIELQRAVKIEQDLAAGQARLKSKKSSISDSLVRLRELEREAGARRSVYESFLLRARETGQQAGISTANTTIVSQAVPPLRPYGTSRKIVALGGLVAGFMLGVALALTGAVWRALTSAEPENEPDSPYRSPSERAGETAPASPSPVNPAPSGGGSRVMVEAFSGQDNANQNTMPGQRPGQNPNHSANNSQGEPMYYPYPSAHYGMINGMAMAHVPQPVMQQPVMMHHPLMQQPMMPQMMMHHAPYGHPMMAPHMMQPQMMQPHPYAQPQIMQPQFMQPVMQQPVVQPVYVAMPQQAQPSFTPVNQPAAQPLPQTVALQSENDYSEIRGRLQSLRDGIVNLAEGRDRLAQLG